MSKTNQKFIVKICIIIRFFNFFFYKKKKNLQLLNYIIKLIQMDLTDLKYVYVKNNNKKKLLT